MKKNIFFFAIAMILTTGLNAQILTVAEGTNTNQWIPVDGGNNYFHKTQTLYPDSILSSIIGKHITSLTYYFHTAPSNAWGGIHRIRMGVTSSSNLQGGFDSANVTTVWTGTLSNNIYGDTLSIILDNPFPYIGGNLLVEMENVALSSASPSSFYGMNQNVTLSYISLYYNTPQYYFGEHFLPKTTFTFEEGCFAPLHTQSSYISPGTILLSWTSNPILPAAGYTIGYKKVNDTVFTEVATSDTFLLLSGLQDAISYEWRVRANCNNVDTSDWNYAGTFTAQPATLPYVCDFEDSDERNSWQFVNYYYRNKWYVGNAVSNGGNYSLYISQNGGSSNTYAAPYASYVWAYRDVYFDPADSGYSLSFDIRSKATGYGYKAYIDVYLGPPADPLVYFVPEGATELATGLYGISNWTTKTYPIDHTHAGLQRLYFLWRNSPMPVTFNPPAAIDNISIEGRPCHVPISLSEYDIIDTMAYLSWTLPNGSADYYTIAYKSLTDTAFSYITSQSEQFPLGNLAPSTSYIWKVRAHCNATEFGVWSEESTFQTMENVARIPYFCGFEDATENSGWYFDSNIDPYNKWVIGHAVNNGGDSSLYVSKDNGATNTYSTVQEGSIWAYRDIYLDPGYSDYMISFDCRAQGTYILNYNQYRAYAKVYLGLPNHLTQIGDIICLDSTWHNVSVQLDSSFAGLQRICIQWNNEYHLAYDPPGAIDNISIIGTHCPSTPTNLTASVSDTMVNLSWSIPDSSTYQYIIAYKSQNDTTYTYIIAQDEQVTLDNLTPLTTYIWKVRTHCSTSDYGFWSEEASFQTTGLLAHLLYACDFEDANDNANWTIVNGNYTNKWFIGNAVSNGGDNALYVSNDNGVSNTYTTSQSISKVWAYRDFFFPPGSSNYQILFDIRCFGELYYNTACDFVKVFLGPPAEPQEVPTGATQLGEAFFNNSIWHTESFILDSTFAGPQRLYFYWKNDNAFGEQPPGAVDNILIYCDNNNNDTCAAPHDLRVVSTSTNSISIQFTPDTDEEQNWQTVIVEADQSLDTTQIIALTDTVYTFNDLQDNTFYTIYVRTDCGDSQSAWCSITQRTDSIPDCLPPTDVTATPISHESVLVNWQPGGSETEWRVVVVLSDDSLEAGTPLLTDTYPVPIGNLLAETSYTVYVQSDCGDTNSLWSSPVYFVTLPNGINLHDMDHLLLLYPNPTNGKCTVRNEQELIETVELFNIFGKRLELLHVNDYQVEINLSVYAANLYFVRVTTEQGKITKRVVKL